MECNRDEAIRAKEIAEKKMLNNDFEGARKIALKARQLFPDLENISHLLAVCDVHCSAQRKINGSEKDLYGILQVESGADEATIRKQYRKLALTLHPDKNKFPGAEAAFKLIGEANMILSDKGKRSLHDIKCREPGRPAISKPQNHQRNQNSHVRTQFGAQNKFSNGSSSQFGGMNTCQQAQSDPNSRPSFWTYCPFCNIKYQYYRDFVNKPLRCQHCSKLFIAYEIGAQGAVPGTHSGSAGMHSANLGSNRGMPAFSQQKDVGRQGNIKVNVQTDGEFPSHFTYQTCSTTGVQPHKRTEDTGVGGGLEGRMKQSGHINMEGKKQGFTMPKDDAEKPKEAEIPTNTNRKSGRKMVVESSESSSEREDAFEETGGTATAGKDSIGVDYPRRSSRSRPQVSYREEDAGDKLSPPKKPRLSESSTDAKDMQKDKVPGSQDNVCNTTEVPAAANVDKEVFKQKATAYTEGSMENGKSENEKHKVKGEEAVTVKDHSKARADSEGHSDRGYIDCPDPEFSNFDNYREENCFAVDQIWACYDSLDGMPRFYAQVKKIFSNGFRLRITWLEAEPENDLEIVWAEEGLPVACGKFVRGDSEETSDRLMFSHQILYEKGRNRFSYVIYPKRGEIWALFKDWDIKWSSDPENHRKYKFEIVEVLSDFHNDNGVLVAYLAKVKGFVSLFQKTSWAGLAEHKIPSRELFRFSHRVPSVKLSGTERAGVPAGSYELDTASLPEDLDDYYYFNELKMEPESVIYQATASRPQSLGEKVPTTGLAGTPKKLVNIEGKICLPREMLNLRRSPRGLQGGDKNHSQLNGDASSTREGGLEQSNRVEYKTNDATVAEGNDPFCNNGDVKTSPHNFTKSPKISSLSSSGGRKSELVIHDFNADRQNWIFENGQIWGCRSKEGIHQCYAQIKKIETSPLRLHVALLEPSVPSKDAVRPNGCGLFKVSTGRTKTFLPDSFLYLVKAEVNGKNRFNIYPREGEIWALYHKQDSECTYSELEGGEYDIVRIVGHNENGITVSLLSRVPGYKSVFRAPRIQRSMSRILEIPRVDLSRFSHQVPAFHFTVEGDGRLKGCCELDPAAVPGLLKQG